MRVRLVFSVVLMAAPLAVDGQTEPEAPVFDGVAVEQTLTLTRSTNGNCNQPPFRRTTTTFPPGVVETDTFEVGRFSCEVLELDADSIRFDHPEIGLRGTLDGANVDLIEPAEFSASLDGEGTDNGGGDPHSFIGWAAIDPEERGTTRASRIGEDCQDAGIFQTNGSTGSGPVRASVTCGVERLDVITNSVETDGERVVKFRAVMTSVVWIRADHSTARPGEAGFPGGIRRGAQVNFELRTVYEFTPLPDDVDYEIDHIQVVQVVQDRGHPIDLVAGKPFMIRVFPKRANPGPPVPAPPVEITVRTAEEEASLQLSGGGTLVVESPFPGDRRHSYNLAFSGSAAEGEMQVTATMNPEETVGEEDLSNNTGDVTVTFVERPGLRVRWVPVCIQSAEHGEVCPTRDYGDLGEVTKRLFPVAAAQFSFERLDLDKVVWSENSLRSLGDEQGLLRKLESVYFDEALQVGSRGETLPASFDQLVGVLPRTVGATPVLGNLALGVAAARWGAFQGRTSLVVDTGRFVQDSFTMAHELGHNYGLAHPNTDECLGPLAGFLRSRGEPLVQRWPQASANIRFHGADPLASEIKVGRPADHPSVQYDLMDGCDQQRQWISDLHYFALLAGDFEPAATAFDFSDFPPVANQAIGVPTLVSGAALLGAGAEILDLRILPEAAAADPPNAEGDQCLLFLDDAGAELGRHCFVLDFRSSEGGPELERQGFSRVVLMPEATKRVVLERLGVEADSTMISDNAPAVEVTAPAAGERWEGGERAVRWSGTYGDGDELTYSVLYSPGGGEGWRVLASEISGSELSVDPALIFGGTDVRFRVIASDGFRRTSAEAGPIEIVQRPEIRVADQPVRLGEAVVGRSVAGEVRIENPGTGPLVVTGASVDSGPFELLTESFPLTVRAGAFRRLRVRYTATAEGAESGTLTILSSAADMAELQVALEGVGTNGQTPRMALDTTDAAFPTVVAGGTSMGSVTIENPSLVELEVSWNLSGASEIRGPADAEPFTIAAEESATLPFTFAPDVAGTFDAVLTVQANDPGRPEATVALSGDALDAPQPPVFSSAGVVSAASFSNGPLAADMWAALFGEDLAEELTAASGSLPTSLGGTRVTVQDGAGVRRAAKLQIAAPGQINFLVPAGSAIGQGLVEVSAGGAASAPVEIATVSPGLFSADASGRGPAAATFLRVAADGARTEGFTFATDSPIRSNVPVAVTVDGDQLFLSFFGTGFRAQSTVTATIGGVSVPVIGAVAQGQFEGLDQVVVGPLPAELAGAGEAMVELTFDGISANVVTVELE